MKKIPQTYEECDEWDRKTIDGLRKFKNFSAFRDSGKKNQTLYNYINKHYRYLVPISYPEVNRKKLVLGFCDKYGYIPNQKSEDKEESKLGYIASYYLGKERDKEFKLVVESYPTWTVFRQDKNKALFLSKCEELGFICSSVRTSINHFMDKNSRDFDPTFRSKVRAFPTEPEYKLKKQIDRIKTECFDGLGNFIGSSSDRSKILFNIEHFPEYKKKDPQDGWAELLASILNFCIANNRTPKRGRNGIKMKTASEEEKIASRFSDAKKANKKGKLNDKNIKLLNKIDEFKQKEK